MSSVLWTLKLPQLLMADLHIFYYIHSAVTFDDTAYLHSSSSSRVRQNWSWNIYLFIQFNKISTLQVNDLSRSMYLRMHAGMMNEYIVSDGLSFFVVDCVNCFCLAWIFSSLRLCQWGLRFTITQSSWFWILIDRCVFCRKEPKVYESCVQGSGADRIRRFWGPVLWIWEPEDLGIWGASESGGSRNNVDQMILGASMWSYSVKNSVNWIQLSTEFNSVNSWIQFGE